MTRAELPSGAWVDYRDALMAQDKFAVQNSVILSFTPEGQQEITGGVQNIMQNALLTQIITAWSYEGIPIPSMNAAGANVIGSTMDIDDYNALTEATAHLLAKVSFVPNPKPSTS
jgi:hypothetical protein